MPRQKITEKIFTWYNDLKNSVSDVPGIVSTVLKEYYVSGKMFQSF